MVQKSHCLVFIPLKSGLFFSSAHVHTQSLLCTTINPSFHFYMTAWECSSSSTAVVQNNSHLKKTCSKKGVLYILDGKKTPVCSIKSSYCAFQVGSEPAEIIPLIWGRQSAKAVGHLRIGKTAALCPSPHARAHTHTYTHAHRLPPLRLSLSVNQHSVSPTHQCLPLLIFPPTETAGWA